MKKALVLGSEGNIGAPLVKHLRGSGVEVLESDIKTGIRLIRDEFRVCRRPSANSFRPKAADGRWLTADSGCYWVRT